MRIVVAMSGGVDSSVAAALLAREGHDVIGLSMQLYDQQEGQTHFGSCCTIDDLRDARRVASTLRIPHYIVNFEQQFDAHVLSNFVGEYLAGRTPIPCSHCNSDLKFASLLDRATAFNAALLATGHYARVVWDEDSGRYLLKRGLDPEKDQSYFLFSLTQAQLACARFPVGDLAKHEVRTLARDLGLVVADKPDSQELCFVPSGEHVKFIEARTSWSALKPGTIQRADGRVLGRHEGIHRFTVGQRKGLGVSTGAPLYVLALHPADGTVVVGPREALERDTLTARNVNWIACPPPASPLRVTARIRHKHREAAASVVATEAGGAMLTFDQPQTAVAPGQAAVFYQDDVVVGGGWIE